MHVQLLLLLSLAWYRIRQNVRNGFATRFKFRMHKNGACKQHTLSLNFRV